MTKQHRPPTLQQIETGRGITYEWVAIADVRSAFPLYGRPVRSTRVADLVAHWDEAKLEAIHVSRRADGTLWRLDGGHRCEAAREVGRTVLYAMVHRNLGVEDEARLFDELNSDRTKPDLWEHWAARLAYHEPLAVELQAITTKAGYTLTPTGSRPGDLRALGALYTIVKYGRAADLVAATLEFHRRVWFYEAPSYKGLVLRAIALFVRTWPKDAPGGYRAARAEEVFTAKPSNLVLQAAERIRWETATPTLTPAILTVVMRDMYNGTMRTGRLNGVPRGGTAVDQIPSQKRSNIRTDLQRGVTRQDLAHPPVRIAAYLATHPGASRREVGRSLGITLTTVRRYFPDALLGLAELP